MPSDANVSLLTQQTITTAAVNGTGFNTNTGTPRRGLNCRLLYSGVTASGAMTYTVKQQKSADNTTYIDSVVGTPITAGTAATQGVLDMKLFAEKAYPWIRLVVTPSIATLSSTGVFQAQVDAAIPG